MASNEIVKIDSKLADTRENVKALEDVVARLDLPVPKTRSSMKRSQNNTRVALPSPPSSEGSPASSRSSSSSHTTSAPGRLLPTPASTPPSSRFASGDKAAPADSVAPGQEPTPPLTPEKEPKEPSSPHIIPTEYSLEEESTPGFDPECVYNVKIGDVFQDRYTVLGKLGYGSASTIWLCRDLSENKYVAVKVYARDSRQAENESKVYAHMKAQVKALAKAKTPASWARELVRSLHGAFDVERGGFQYSCLVHEPLYFSLPLYKRGTGGTLDLVLVKMAAKHLLYALDYLHTQAGVVHTDVQPNNLLLKLDDQSLLDKFAREEQEEPSPRKIDGDRTVYMSRPLGTQWELTDVILCDFGEAVFGAQKYGKDVMPDPYRAPEIVMHQAWDAKIDIWGAAMTIWSLLEGGNLYTVQDPHNPRGRMETKAAHLARTVALLGPPPKTLPNQWHGLRDFFDEDGNFLPNIDIPDVSLESEATRLEGEEKDMFLRFMRRMLKWLPEERAEAEDLVDDEWLGGKWE